jgi:hypothetical protein
VAAAIQSRAQYLKRMAMNVTFDPFQARVFYDVGRTISIDDALNRPGIGVVLYTPPIVYNQQEFVPAQFAGPYSYNEASFRVLCTEDGRQAVIKDVLDKVDSGQMLFDTLMPGGSKLVLPTSLYRRTPQLVPAGIQARRRCRTRRDEPD